MPKHKHRGQRRLLSKLIKNVPVGTKFGNLVTLGVPFGIRHDNGYKVVHCVTECSICNYIGVHILDSLKIEHKKGHKCCKYCTLNLGLIVNDYSRCIVNQQFGSYRVLGKPFRIRTATGRKEINVVVECKCKNIYVRNVCELLDSIKLRYIKCIKCASPINALYDIKDPNRSKTRLHRIWGGMISRCLHDIRYSHIKYHPDWESYDHFRDWAYKNGYYEQDKDTPRSEQLSIDRIDPKKDYCPQNCRWITVSENSKHVTKGRDDKITQLENRVRILENILQQHNIEVPL